MKTTEENRSKYLHGQPKKMSVEQKFHLLLRLLRRDFPPKYPVRVQRVNKIDKHGTLGWCNLVSGKNKYFLIRVKSGTSWDFQFDTIIHEWAHCLTWHTVTNEKFHNNAFARKFGTLYRKYVED